MPAPRLLDKRTISATLATERKQQIDEGRRLTDAIEALREAKVKETQALEDFRRETLKKIEIEIEELTRQRNALLQEIRSLTR